MRSEGRRALAVDGIVQSIEVIPDEPTPGYWPHMLPDRPVERGLLLGFGGGTIARLLLDANPGIHLLAIDDDEKVLATAKRSLRLRIDDPRLTIRLGDAFATTRELADANASFDYIAIDLYRAAVFDRGAIARPFLRRLRELGAPDGIVAFNLIRDGATGRRLRRIAQYLRIVETRLIGLNCVILTRPIAQ